MTGVSSSAAGSTASGAAFPSLRARRSATRCLKIARAWTTKSRQICAGNVPPATGSPPNSVFIGVSLSGYPTHTAIVISRVNPTNQASPKSSVVPVLPAAKPP